MAEFCELAKRILKDRYLWKDSEGNTIETLDGFLHRVAHEVAKAEKPERRKAYEDRFYTMMRRLDFLPNSPTLMNAGRPKPHGQLAACFVVGIEDNMPAICEALRQQMLIHKTGGGTGFNFSTLRPKNSMVNSTNGRASGPVSFMRMFDLSTEVIQQGGMRRGANMGILNADHKDIREFIHCKDKDGVITNFNLSVGVTDEFMHKATTCCWGEEAALLYEIAEQAWKTGDPGIVFLDTINRDNPNPELGKITSTNPCGESPLLAGEACNLGSINLSNMVVNGWFDWASFDYTIRHAVRMLDDIIDVGQYPLPEIEKAVKRTRKIGLGIMGFADMLYKMKIRYGSEESLAMADNIMGYMQEIARAESGRLGFEKGIPEANKYLHRRNATVTCIAPTGTLALLADCSSGIEPVFSLHHTRTITTQKGEKVNEDIFNPIYMQAVRDKNISDEEIEEVFVTAYGVPWDKQIEMQSRFQKNTDLAVSKTVNLPNNATVDDILACYIFAWKLNCKGTTIYRDGSKGTQVLTENSGALPEPKCSTC